MGPGKNLPLVIFLHGAGERGDDNQAQLKHGSSLFASDKTRNDYPALVAFPQCPKGQWWSGDNLKNALALTHDLTSRYPVDPDRVYITGISMGGFGSWAAISAEPETFAAAAPICGGGNPKKADEIKDIPIWAFHGADDTVVKPDKSREMVEAVKQAGGSPKYTEYPKVKHNSWDQVFKDPDYLSWLFSQKKK
jgi:predicted peptidase